MQTSGGRARLRSTASTRRPFFPPTCDRLAAFDLEIAALENGSHQRLHEGLADIQRRKAEQIESAEIWRSDRILNIENEFGGAVKAALDQYNEDVKLLRNRLVDEVKRNRRRYMDTNGFPSPPAFRKKPRAVTITATSTRSASAALQSQQKPVVVRTRLSDNEIRADLKRIEKPFAAQAAAPRQELVRVEEDRLYIGNIAFRLGDEVVCGRHDQERKCGKIAELSSTEVWIDDPETKEKSSLPLVYFRSGMASIMKKNDHELNIGLPEEMSEEDEDLMEKPNAKLEKQ